MRTHIGCVLALSLLLPLTEREAGAATWTARELAPPGLALKGPDYKVRAQASIIDHYPRYLIDTDFGPIEAWGNAELAERLGEMPALRALDSLSKNQAFADAVGASVRNAGSAVIAIAEDPAGTARALPAGIGRSLGRALSSARRAALSVGDAWADSREEDESESADRRSAPRPAPSRAEEEARALVDELSGINRALRDIARALGIDPYTRNPLIQTRMRGLATATALGGAPLSLALGQVSNGLSDVVANTQKIHRLAWDKPPEELRDLLEQRLRRLGAEGRKAREFLRNRAFSPTQQLQVVEALEALGSLPGLGDVLKLAAGTEATLHPRFLIRQLQHMASLRGSEQVVSLSVVDALCVGAAGDGRKVIVLPVDYLHWSDTLGQTGEFDPDQAGLLIIEGRATTRAARTLKAAGWTVRMSAEP